MGTTHQFSPGGSTACRDCPFASACLPEGMSDECMRDLEAAVERTHPTHAGKHLFRQGEAFSHISIIRLGTVKTYAMDRDGGEQTIAFHMPGDVLGLDAIDENRHPCNAIALDTVVLCKLPFSVAAELAARTPSLQKKLFRMMSRDIVRGAKLSGNHTADERLAAFLVGMADRFGARGFSSSRWQLAMSRSDIASYLNLAPATLSRMLRRFQDDGLVSLEGCDVELHGRDRLEEMASPLLQQ